DLDGRAIDLRDRRDGKKRIRCSADGEDRRHQQGCGNRPLNEVAGNAHRSPPTLAVSFFDASDRSAGLSCLLPSLVTVTFEPGCRRDWPLTTIGSPSAILFDTTTTYSPNVSLVSIGRTA